MLSGEYVVNALHFVSHSQEPVPIALTVTQLSPAYRVVHYGVDELSGQGNERTMIRFTIGEDGNAVAMNDDFVSLADIVRGR